MIQLAYAISPDGVLSVPYSEHARRGHPDRFANMAAESIVLHALSRDPCSRVDAAVSVGYDSRNKRDVVTVNGNSTTKARIDDDTLHALVASVARDLGYADAFGFDPGRFALHPYICAQSDEIAPYADNHTAADSRPCYGFACNETPSYLPRSAEAAKAISDRLDAAFHDGISLLGPDGKVQVMAQYNHGKPELRRAVVHVQCAGAGHETERFLREILEPFAGGARLLLRTFSKGGPRQDKGQSGTKSLMYGEAMPHGGGMLYGLDPTKPEVYGTAIARQAAKSIVGNGLAEQCRVQIAYTMGTCEPDIHIEGSPQLHGRDIRKLLARLLLPPSEAIQEYRLRDPDIIRSVIEHGFIGNELLPWERIIEI